MKKFWIAILIVSVLCFSGCRRDMNYVIQNEPNIAGTVIQTVDQAILIENDSGQYWVSLDVEYADSMTRFQIDDEVVVYYDGMVAESYPMQINTVYAITLQTPADRSVNDQP